MTEIHQDLKIACALFTLPSPTIGQLCELLILEFCQKQDFCIIWNQSLSLGIK